MAVALVIWFFLCRTTASEVRPRPSPSPTPTPEGHVKEVGTVEVSGAKFTLYAFLPGYHWRYATVDAEFNRSLLTKQEMVSDLTQLNGTISLGDAVIAVGR